MQRERRLHLPVLWILRTRRPDHEVLSLVWDKGTRSTEKVEVTEASGYQRVAKFGRHVREMPHSLWQPPDCDWHPSCWSSLDYHRHSERNRWPVFNAIQDELLCSPLTLTSHHLKFWRTGLCTFWRRTNTRPPIKLFIIATSVWSHSRALLDWLTSVALPRWLENWPGKERG